MKFIKIFSLCFLLISFANAKIDKLVISGPFATVSHPFAIMMEKNALEDIASKVEFRLWKNPDELRAIALNNEANFIALPTNVGANLYNKGVNIKMLEVSIWGILNILSRDKNIKTLKDLKGQEIAVPFRSDMPDIVFKELLKRQGIDPDKDLKIVYLSTPIDAMQMLITRKIDNALLAEPAVSMALRKTQSFPVSIIAPSLFRSVDLQKEWGKTFKKEEAIPQAAIAVLNELDPKITKRFIEEYDKALLWYKENPKEASIIVHKYFPMLNKEAVEDSISSVNLKSVSAKDAREDLEFFFEILLKDTPKSIGSKLPDDGFYY